MIKHGIFFKLTVRDIRHNFLQYLSMIIITMLAVNLFCGFISNTLTVKGRIDDYFEKSNLTDLTVQFSAIDVSDFKYFESLKRDEIIDEYEYRFYAEGSVGQNSGKIYAGKNTISSPVLVEGKAGVLLDVGLKKDYSIGDFIEVEILGLPAISLEITGFMYFVEVAMFTYTPIYIDEDLFCKILSQKTGLPYSPKLIYNQTLIKTQKPTEDMAKINEYYAAESGGFIFVYDRQSIDSVVALEGEVKTSRQMIYIFPVIFLLVSVLVTMTTVSALILRERTNIGTLKALGIDNKKIVLHYAFFGALLCFLGGSIGALTASLVVPNALNIKYGLIYSLPPSSGIVFSAFWSLIAISFVTVLAIVIGFIVCKSVIREKPAECMRPAVPKDSMLMKLTTLNLSKNKSAKNKKGNLPLKMAIRNITVKPTRALMTIVGIVGCVALLVCSFGIGDTVNNSVDLELGRQFYYDINTTYNTAAEKDFLSLMDESIADGSIRNYETYKIFYMTAHSETMVKNIKIYQIAQDSLFTNINPKDGVLISKKIADEMKVGKGDVLNVVMGADSYKLNITGIVETAITNGIFISSNQFGDSYHTSAMWISADVTDELLEFIKQSSGTNDAFSISERHDTIMRIISSIDTIKLTMMIFSIALSLVVLYNLSLLNLKERNRSLATLKVLGFSNTEISLSLIYEMMLLVLLGTILGLFLGFPILYLVLSVNKVEIIMFIYKIKLVSYVLAALISFVTAVIINVIFGFLIKKISMIDSLKSVD